MCGGMYGLDLQKKKKKGFLSGKILLVFLTPEKKNSFAEFLRNDLRT